MYPLTDARCGSGLSAEQFRAPFLSDRLHARNTFMTSSRWLITFTAIRPAFEPLRMMRSKAPIQDTFLSLRPIGRSANREHDKSRSRQANGPDEHFAEAHGIRPFLGLNVICWLFD